jgi:hypothetical protein
MVWIFDGVSSGRFTAKAAGAEAGRAGGVTGRAV